MFLFVQSYLCLLSVLNSLCHNNYGIFVIIGDDVVTVPFMFIHLIGPNVKGFPFDP